MSTLATGILSGKLDWSMILTGMGVGVVLVVVDEVLKRFTRLQLPPLAVGLGIYLPSAVTTPVTIGAIIGWLADRRLKKRAKALAVATSGQPFEAYAELPRRRGTLVASGLIVGESLVGVILAGLIVATDNQSAARARRRQFRPDFSEWLGWPGLVFLLACVDLYRRIANSKKERII